MLNSLALKGFLVFRDQVEIDFSPVTILIGNSGSGKSSIFEGILYNLFNATPRTFQSGAGIEDLINDRSAEAYTRLDLTVKGIKTVVERARVNRETSLDIRFGDLVLKGTPTEKIEKLSQLLNFPAITSSSFLRAVYFSRQNLAEPFPTELSRSWIYDLFDRVHELLSSLLKEVSEQTSILSGKIVGLESSIRRFQELKRTESQTGSSEEFRKLLTEIQTKANEARRSWMSLKEKRELLGSGLNHSVCPMCQQEITESIKSKLSSIIKDLEETMSKFHEEEIALTIEESSLRSKLEDSIKAESLRQIGKSLAGAAQELTELANARDTLEKRSLLLNAGVKDTASIKNSFISWILSRYIIPVANSLGSKLFEEEVVFEALPSKKSLRLKAKLGSKSSRYYELLSTGEQIRSQLVIKLASSKVLSSLISSPFILFDEVFDSLDLDAASRVMHLLLSELGNKQIILASHRPIDVLREMTENFEALVYQIKDQKIEKI